MSQLITPEILRGTRDFLPAEMAKRLYVMEKIRNVFIHFGYDTIETPVIEYLKTLTGSYGEEGNKLMYSFEDNGGRKIALRYDQTVPTARVVAKYAQDLPMPFKRYQISRVWRADRPAKGRYREFYQCDIDTIGTYSLVADAETAKVVYSVMSELGFTNFVIKFNSRKLINRILEQLGIAPENQIPVIRTLDKITKVDRIALQQELSLLMPAKTAEALLKIVSASGSNQEKMEKFAAEDIQEISQFLALCADFAIPEKYLEFDLSLARGLDYYTGIIYEVMLNDVEIGSVCGGGRYDDLCSRFTTEKFGGVGVAFGFDRLVTALGEKGLLQDIGLNTQILITYFDPATLPDSIKLLGNLQAAGISTELYFEPVKLTKQMKYADKKGIPFVVFCGPEEVRKNEVKIRMMKTGKEKVIPRNQLVGYFQGLSRART